MKKGLGLNIKIVLTIVVVAIISSSSGFVGYLRAEAANKEMERLVEDEFAYYQQVLITTQTFAKVQDLQKEILLFSGDLPAQKIRLKEYEKQISELEGQFSELQIIIAGDAHFPEEVRVIGANLKGRLSAYVASINILDENVMISQGLPLSQVRSLTPLSDRHSAMLIQNLELLMVSGDELLKAEVLLSKANSSGAVILLIGLSLGSFLLSLVAGYFISRAITQPIRLAVSRLEEIAGGGGDLTQKLQVRTGDELGQLAHQFNIFIQGLGLVIRSIAQSTGKLRGLGLDLSANMEESSSSVNQIAANIESVKQLIIGQSAGVTEVSATMEEIDKNIESLAKRISNQTQSVSRSSSSIEQMVANIQSVTRNLETNSAQFDILLKVSGEGREKLEEVTNQIREVSRQSEGLMEANTVIESIASQTNLLAMNAAIEAAHAGEAGKGFAVVSDEIRKLAEGASAQSKSISHVLKSLVDSIEGVVDSTTEATLAFETVQEAIETTSQMERQVKNAMEEQSSGSNEVLEALTEISGVTAEVNSGAIEMRQGSGTIIQELQRLVQITQEVRQSMDEMTQGIVEINSSFAAIVTMTQQNRVAIEGVEEQVSHFKTE